MLEQVLFISNFKNSSSLKNIDCININLSTKCPVFNQPLDEILNMLRV